MALKEPSRMVKSARTAFEIVEYIHQQDGAELDELAAHFDLAKSTVHGYLATLEALEYVIRERGTYRLGLKFLYHGMAAKNSRPVSHIAEDILGDLAEETSLVAWLIVEEHGHAVYLQNEMGDQAVQTYGRVSKRTGLHVLAGGKAILAHLPESTVDDIVETYGLPAQTEHTITTDADLFDELRTIRARGYAISEHEAALGVRSVAAPVLHGDKILCAVSVSGMSNQVEEEYFEEELPSLVIDAATNLAERYEQLYG